MGPCTAAGPGRPRGHSRPVSVGRANSLNLGASFRRRKARSAHSMVRGGGLQTGRNSVVLCAALGMFLRVSRRITFKVQELEKGSWGAGRGSAGGTPTCPWLGAGLQAQRSRSLAAHGGGVGAPRRSGSPGPCPGRLLRGRGGQPGPFGLCSRVSASFTDLLGPSHPPRAPASQGLASIFPGKVLGSESPVQGHPHAHGVCHLSTGISLGEPRL